MPTDRPSPFGCVVLTPSSDTANRPRRSTRDDDTSFRERLADFLIFLVPLCIAELSTASDQEIDHVRTHALEQIASHGDDLQFGGKHQRSSRTALAKALAVLARAEGGVTALGVHACLAPHEGCPGRQPRHTTSYPVGTTERAS
ncbi:hypothetical protein OG689_44560 [Kitasatospora sp. NBC_00240]|uniref:hypothetical protein n=1 Tax=Kitasatospora sp. NBC_00240 TaxID=2903567 RepID=UPI00225539FE|nr:hypothetical protein [Kitasatospora sp. NBC_00240]MCX5216212.1 hypothetical protein [Kitasatospora sp. NBC_00240]